MLFNKASSLTVSVACKDNMQALLMCLTSVLTGTTVPACVLLRIESALPEFDNFYLGQIAALCRLADVEFQLHYCKSEGVHATRQWQVENAKTQYLMFLDDDVVIRHDCIFNLLAVGQNIRRENPNDKPWIYLQGCKGDVNNRRGYGNFDLTVKSLMSLKPGEEINFNCFYHPDTCFTNRFYVPVQLCDTGCLLLDRHAFSDNSLSFLASGRLTNAGGEDTLFALLCESKGLLRYVVPQAVAFHLEKPFVRMGEHAYRKALILRTAEATGLPTGAIMDKVLPWEPIHDFTKRNHVGYGKEKLPEPLPETSTLKKKTRKKR